MRFVSLPIAGAWLIEIEPLVDERGFFARTLSRDQFERQGISTDFFQQSIAFNAKRNVVRGLHWQSAPHAEEKLVRVTKGAIFDVIVDIRRESPTFGRWFGVDLSEDNRSTLFVPKRIAHGYQTLTDISEVHYQITAAHCPQAARGLRWNDATIGITWPAPAEAILSERDRTLPLWGDA